MKVSKRYKHSLAILIIGISTLIIGACVSACATAPSKTTLSWNYKMTVIVDTPEGEKAGFSIRRVTVKKANYSKVYQEILQGEAVAVDLGKRGVLFAILKSHFRGRDYGAGIAFSAFPAPRDTDPAVYLSELKSEKKILPLQEYPTFVHFKNPADASSSEKVIEMKSDNKWPPKFSILADRTEEIFGAGVKIKEVNIEMTDEQPTFGIKQFLPKFDTTPHLVSLEDFKQGN